MGSRLGLDGDDQAVVVVVSDLHMSSRLDAGSATLGPTESFREDDVFARFLDDVAIRSRRVRNSCRLVILGDLLDFLHVRTGDDRERGPRPETSEIAAHAKLERIASGHRDAFAALGKFAAAGFPIEIVPGNHDIELMRQRTQERLRELIVECSGRREAAARISFQPWISFVPGLCYAEHGSQYHDINAFETLLHPYRADGEIDLPVGSFLTAHQLDLAESLGFVGGSLISPLQALSALKGDSRLARSALSLHARFLAVALARSLRLSGAIDAQHRSDYRARRLSPYAQAIGLPYESVVGIDELAAVTPLAAQRRALRLLLERLARRPRTTRPDYLRRAAFEVDRVLRQRASAVPFYVFGHAHKAELTRLDPSGSWYLNSGTWSTLVPRGLETLGSRARFTFVEIVQRGEASAPVACLYRWNDQAGRRELLATSSSPGA